MKTSEVLKILIDYKKYGDRELNIDLLTENQSNLIHITDIYSTHKI